MAAVINPLQTFVADADKIVTPGVEIPAGAEIQPGNTQNVDVYWPAEGNSRLLLVEVIWEGVTYLVKATDVSDLE